MKEILSLRKLARIALIALPLRMCFVGVEAQQVKPIEIEPWVVKLKDPNDDVRYKASKVLSETAFEFLVRSERSELLISTLEKCLNGDAYHLVRANCAIGLYNSGKYAVNALATLTTALADKSPLVRGWATNALAGLGALSKSALPKILQGLDDKDNRVRRNSAFAVLRIDPSRAVQAVPVLVKELEFSDANRDMQDSIRDEVARNLKQLSGPAATLAVNELQRMLAHPDRGVQGRAKDIVAFLTKARNP